RDVVRPPHADEGPLVQGVFLVRPLVADRLDQGRDVVRVAGDDLDEAVLARDQDLVVDAAGVRLAEAELAPLGEEALGTGEPFVELLLVLIAGRRAVDHHGGAFQRLAGVVAHLVPHLLELAAHVLVDGELGAALDQVADARTVAGERRALVEGDFVNAQAVPEVGEQPQQRLTDRARAHHVDNPLHGCPSLEKRMRLNVASCRWTEEAEKARWKSSIEVEENLPSAARVCSPPCAQRNLARRPRRARWRRGPGWSSPPISAGWRGSL